MLLSIPSIPSSSPILPSPTFAKSDKLPSKFNFLNLSNTISLIPTYGNESSIDFIEIANSKSLSSFVLETSAHYCPEVPAFTRKASYTGVTGQSNDNLTTRLNLQHLSPFNSYQQPGIFFQGSTASSLLEAEISRPSPTVTATGSNGDIESPIQGPVRATPNFHGPGTALSPSTSSSNVKQARKPEEKVNGSIFLKRKKPQPELYTRPPKRIRTLHGTQNVAGTEEINVAGPSDAAHNGSCSSSSTGASLNLFVDTSITAVQNRVIVQSPEQQSPFGGEDGSLFSETEAPPVSDTDVSEDSDDDNDDLFGSDRDQRANESDSSQNFDEENVLTHNEEKGKPLTVAPVPAPPLVDGFKVARWVEILERLAAFAATENLNPKFARQLYDILQQINMYKGDTYFTPQVLLESRLAKTLKQFRHSPYELQTRRIANEVTKAWRKLCNES
ncbi:hypothetical protein JR316_0004523 [Psilocybe cubensis]|nr:hypothetical protein JR316_0004523 [Psilocybe cubensis]KAH9482423.1 hypothetical protein JR316_0004523 [Psilocybe cubensis]